MSINDKLVIHGIGMQNSPIREAIIKFLIRWDCIYEIVPEHSKEFNIIQQLRRTP